MNAFCFSDRSGRVQLWCVSHTLQSELESGLEARIEQIYFKVACDKITHQEILYKLCSVDITCMLTQFLSNRA